MMGSTVLMALGRMSLAIPKSTPLATVLPMLLATGVKLLAVTAHMPLTVMELTLLVGGVVLLAAGGIVPLAVKGVELVGSRSATDFWRAASLAPPWKE